MSPPMTIRDQALLGSAQASECTEVEQEQLGFDDYRNMYQAGQAGVGMWLATADALGVGAKLLKFSGFLKQVGSASGTIYCRVYNQTSLPNASASLDAQADTEIDVSTVSTSVYEEVEFTFDGTYTLKVGDLILAWYDGGSGGGYISAKFKTSDVYDGTDSVSGYQHSSNFREVSSNDPTMKITYCET